jgi:cyclase
MSAPSTNEKEAGVSLVALVPGLYGWFQTPAGHGRANAGVILDEDGATVIDSLFTASQWEPFAQEIEALGLPIRRLVLTSSNAEFVGGSSRFKMAAVYGRAQCSVHLDQPASVGLLRHFYPAVAEEIGEEFLTRSVSHVIDAPVSLTSAAVAVPLGGQQEENLVVVAPGAGVVFAGAMAPFGVTPIAAQGNPALWADALDDLLELAPVVVPGHGAVGGEEQVRELQGYLRACVRADGDTSRMPHGPWDLWPGREWDVVNVERAALLARGEDEVPPTLFQYLGLRPNNN